MRVNNYCCLQHSETNTMPENYIFDVANKVWVKEHYFNKIPYCDGNEIEQKIFNSVKNSTDVTVLSDELESHIFDWTSLCFLSKRRSNLLRPFTDLFKGKHILEPGCGAGPITRFLGECGAYVYAVEPNLQRAKIAAERCRDLPNVKIYCDDIENFAIDQSFDGIIQVGVLEYASKYSDEANAPLLFLKRLKELLKEDGFLITAIENQLGLKYFSGFFEDHVGTLMHGINDNYQPRQVTTFGKEQLLALLGNAGFSTNRLFLPFPDYKLPSLVVFPDFYEKSRGFDFKLDNILSNLSYMDRQQCIPLFSLDKALPLVAQNGLLYDLSNSFCFLSQLKPGSLFNEDILLSLYNTERKRSYCKETVFTIDKDAVKIVRNHLGEVANSNENVISFLPQEQAHPGTLYHYELVKIVNQHSWTIDQMTQWLAGWFTCLKKELMTLEYLKAEEFSNLHLAINSRYLDAIPINLIINRGQFQFIDLEVDLHHPIELGYLIFRAIYVSLSRLSSIAPPQDESFCEAKQILHELFAGLGFHLTEEQLDKYYEYEAELASSVTSSTIKTLKNSISRLRVRPVLTNIDPLEQQNRHLQEHNAAISNEIAVVANRNRELEATLQKANEYISQLNGQVDHLSNQIEEKERHILSMETQIVEFKIEIDELMNSRKKMLKQFLKKSVPRYFRN